MGTAFLSLAYSLFIITCIRSPFVPGCFAQTNQGSLSSPASNFTGTPTTSANTPPTSLTTLNNSTFTSQSLLSTTISSTQTTVGSDATNAPTASISSSGSAPTSSGFATSTQTDIWTVQNRRTSSIIGAMGSVKQLPNWLSSLGSNGKWPDSEVNYATGCDAQRANWPAQTHWQRILVMAGAWHGGLKGADQYVKSSSLRTAISSAMSYWFSRDFSNIACLDAGGTAACPCTNADNSLWNTNWFSNIILIPELVSQTCLLLNDTLSSTELGSCTHFTSRSYATFSRSINGVGTLTGANTLDVAKIGIDQGLLTLNASLLTDAYQRVHAELQIKNTIKADGIRADGAFGQHSGMLYNGNYGKDYTNDLLDLEIEAANTQYAASVNSRSAFATLFNGDKWMIFRNTLTGVLHWDFSALGRFISFPVVDNQATGSIKINLTQVLELGTQWSSTELTSFTNDLSPNSTSANAGNLIGNKMFYTSDYMVNRGPNYVSTVKMYSNRTQNTECTNSQNPLGLHLSDGAQYIYLRGDEYEDIAVAWDWNLIPGITIDYGGTPLACGTTQQTGVEGFVGGASDGKIGLATLRFTNPITKALRFQKAWFFLEDDIQHVMVNIITSPTSAPLYTVLDQKRHRGAVFIDGAEDSTPSGAHGRPRSLWHADMGYAFPDLGDSVSLSVQVGQKSGAWSTIGTSTQPNATVDLFAAWIEHKNRTSPVSYTVFPGTTFGDFTEKQARVRLHSVQNDQQISALYDEDHQVIMVAFWGAKGGSTTITMGNGQAPITIASTGNIVLIYRLESGQVSVSDPSQTLSSVRLTFTLGSGTAPGQWGSTRTKTLTASLPTGPGGTAGSSITSVL